LGDFPESQCIRFTVQIKVFESFRVSSNQSFDSSSIQKAMPQNISNSKVILHPSQRAQRDSRQHNSQVDSFADRLMDDLFADVENLLDGSVAPPPEPVRTEAPLKPSLDLSAYPQLADLVARPSLPQWNLQPQPEESLSVPEVTELVNGKVKPAAQGLVLQKFLMGALITSAIAAIAVWFTNRSSFSIAHSQPATAIATPAQTAPSSKAEQFADHVQRSLASLDRKAATGKPGFPLNNSLPTVAIASKPAVKSEQPLPTANLLPPALPIPNVPKTPVVINVPPAPASSVTVNDPARRELNQLLTRLSAVLEKLYPALNRPQVAVQPVTLPTPQVATAAAPVRSVRGVAIASDPTQSAVLIETNGITQRYYMGESIGSSGWSVVDIANNYVSLRRNGEVRSVSVGEKLN
jgi:hypothetical protein